MSACHGCGAELPPSPGARPRKWCSERCRKAQYAGACADCGKATDGSNGRGPNAPKRCVECQLRHQHDDRYWTPERIVAAIQKFAERYGDAPVAAEWHPPMARKWGHHDWADRFHTDGCWPDPATVQREFGTWNAAIEAAGFTPGRPGIYRDPDQRYRMRIADRHGIAARYAAGETAAAVAADFQITAVTVLRYAREAGVPIRRGAPPVLSEFDIERATRLYAQGYTLRMLAAEFFCADTTIWRALTRAGVQTRSRGHNRTRPKALAA